MDFPSPGDNLNYYKDRGSDNERGHNSSDFDLSLSPGSHDLSPDQTMSSSDRRPPPVNPNFFAADNAAATAGDNNTNKRRPVRPPPPPPRPRRVETIRELNAQEVRWFYKEDKKWQPFIGYDSLQLEWQFRHWKEEGARGSVDRILVRGGIFEVDLLERKCFPVYWAVDEAQSVMRGPWFFDGSWYPLEEDYAFELESTHLARYLGQQVIIENNDSTRGLQSAVVSKKFKECHVDWYAATEVYLYNDNTTSKVVRSVAEKVGINKASSGGTKLHRGYVMEAKLDDKPPPVSHLVFVIHGIGQMMEKGKITLCCSDLARTSKKVILKHFPQLNSAASVDRIEFLPVEWRTKLSLDGDVVDSITPDRLKSLRGLLNSSAMDIMYYTSPMYWSEIVRGLQAEINRLYRIFCDRNPGFQANHGKVSVLAHSLGSVIIYDILTGWNPIHLYDQYLASDHGAHPDVHLLSQEQELLAAQLMSARKRVTELEQDLLSRNQVSAVLNMPKLDFKVENLFCCGSPLAVFLTLRNIRPQGIGTQDHIISKKICQRIFNIFHPTDPVAYRIEPLILKHYSTIMPVQINRWDSAKQTPYSEQETLAYSTAKVQAKEMVLTSSSPSPVPKRNSLTGSLGSMITKFMSKSETVSLPGPGGNGGDDILPPHLQTIQQLTIQEQNASRDQGVPIPIDSVELEKRIDFTLKEGSFQNAYYAALTSHTAYWTSSDMVLFMLMHIFPDYLSSNRS